MTNKNFKIKYQDHFKLYILLKDKIIFESMLYKNKIDFYIEDNQAEISSGIRYFFKDQDREKIDSIIIAHEIVATTETILSYDYRDNKKIQKLYLIIFVIIAIIMVAVSLIENTVNIKYNNSHPKIYKRNVKIFSTLFLIAVANLSAQTIDSNIQITSSELFKLRVDRYMYEYSGSFFEDGKIPNFTDSRNFNVKTTLVNTATKKEMDLPNEHVADTLNLIPQLILLNLEKKTISIKGTVSGGWNGGKSDVHIYIGQRNDTIQHIKLVPTLEANIIYNGTELKETVIVDTIPAFNLKKFTHVNSENAYEDHPQRAFEIIAPIEKSSILAIGQNDCFAEIFEIGKLLEYNILPEKGKKKKK